MIGHCRVCGESVPENMNFCPRCGSVIRNPQAGGTNNFSPMLKPPHISFLFVASLVIMIIFAISVINAFTAVPDLFDLLDLINDYGSGNRLTTGYLYIGTAFITLIMIVVSFIWILNLFIASSKAKNNYLSMEERIQKASKVKKIAIIALVLVSITLFSELLNLISINTFIDAWGIRDYMDNDLNRVYFSFFCDFVYLGFAIAFVVKSRGFYEYLIYKSQQEQHNQDGY